MILHGFSKLTVGRLFSGLTRCSLLCSLGSFTFCCCGLLLACLDLWGLWLVDNDLNDMNIIGLSLLLRWLGDLRCVTRSTTSSVSLGSIDIDFRFGLRCTVELHGLLHLFLDLSSVLLSLLLVCALIVHFWDLLCCILTFGALSCLSWSLLKFRDSFSVARRRHHSFFMHFNKVSGSYFVADRFFVTVLWICFGLVIINQHRSNLSFVVLIESVFMVETCRVLCQQCL